MDSTPPLAALALAITAQDWTSLGFGDDPNIAATDDFETTVERLTALMLVRIVAIASPEAKFPDLSTTTICRAALLKNDPCWPAPITNVVIDQLREYVRRILGTYIDTPYHNCDHCYHVTISINKLLDLILCTDIQGNRLHPTFGLRSDSLMQLVLVYSALIHDAEHRGIPNRQLVLDDDPLAILYNDQSIAENRSLFLGFSELLKDEFKELRNAMFLTQDEYRRFRKGVVNLVLTTDIASPERTQIGKSKWKEAFGDPFETVERKVRSEIRRRQSMSSGASPSVLKLRRASACSMYSEITTDIPEGEPYDEDDVSPSITPDSSYNGEEYSTDDDLSQDGMIVSSKPFSNVISSSHLKEKYPPEADQLGYEPDSQNEQKSDLNNNINVIHEDLGYDNMSKHSNSSVGGGDGGAKSPPNSKIVARLSNFAGKKALPNPAANRNKSMSDFKGEDTFKTLLTNAQDQSGTINPKQMAKFQRRFSTSVVGGGATTKKYKYRLGILRAVDLSGEAIETYSRGSATGAVSLAAISFKSPSVKSVVAGSISDEIDELKLAVVMEQLITACDVAHNLQSWDHMVKWSNRLYLELKKGHKEGRGGDPKTNWFENQIGFLESYLLPLARRLEDTGVFGDVIGPVFARLVEANRDRWLTDGLGVTSDIIAKSAEIYPMEGDTNND